MWLRYHHESLKIENLPIRLKHPKVEDSVQSDPPHSFLHNVKLASDHTAKELEAASKFSGPNLERDRRMVWRALKQASIFVEAGQFSKETIVEHVVVILNDRFRQILWDTHGIASTSEKQKYYFLADHRRHLAAP